MDNQHQALLYLLLVTFLLVQTSCTNLHKNGASPKNEKISKVIEELRQEEELTSLQQKIFSALVENKNQASQLRAQLEGKTKEEQKKIIAEAIKTQEEHDYTLKILEKDIIKKDKRRATGLFFALTKDILFLHKKLQEYDSMQASKIIAELPDGPGVEDLKSILIKLLDALKRKPGWPENKKKTRRMHRWLDGKRWRYPGRTFHYFVSRDATKVRKKLEIVRKKIDKLDKKLYPESDRKFDEFFDKNYVEIVRIFLVLKKRIGNREIEKKQTTDPDKRKILDKEIKYLKKYAYGNPKYLYKYALKKKTPAERWEENFSIWYAKLWGRSLPQPEVEQIRVLYDEALEKTQSAREAWESKRKEYQELWERYKSIRVNYLITQESALPTKVEKNAGSLKQYGELKIFQNSLKRFGKEFKKLEKQALISQ